MALYLSSPQYVFMAWYLVEHGEKFTFNFFRVEVEVRVLGSLETPD
jgi:hypothetical protein